MATINSVFDIAKTALLTSQKAINVTSHNISNAGTPGYSRQVAVLEPMNAVNYGGLYYGTGVTVQKIERVYDSFQAVQIRNANSSFKKYETMSSHLTSLENALNDLGGAGLNSYMDSFFNSFQDVANSPSSYAERSTLLSNAGLLTERFNGIDSTINQGLSDFNKEIVSQVNQINSIASQLAEINQQISTSEVGGSSANDLRDKRDSLLNSLSGIIDVSVMETDTGSVDVFIGGGSYLVTGAATSPVELRLNPDSSTYDIRSNGVTLNSRITGGCLKGIIDSSAVFEDSRNKLDTLAVSLTKEINLQHRAGYGLDGSTGLDFFTLPPVYTNASSNNTGGAAVAGGFVSDLSLLTPHDYEVRFSNPASYNVVDTTSNSVISTGAYVSGGPITVDGLTFTITDNTGTPRAGDTFVISPTKGASANFGVELTDPNSLAASSTTAGIPGDNNNALSMAALKDSPSINGATFSEYYGTMVTDIGISSSEASSNLESQRIFLNELQTARESVSGVSVEEESINLIKLQRAYEAAAKVMQTANTMLDALLNIA